MSPTEEQCNIHREKIMEKTEKCFNNLQQSMGKTNERIFEKLDDLGKNFVELNANFQNVYKTQLNVLKEQEAHGKDILLNKIWIAGIGGALALLSILFPYFVSRYFDTILDKENVEIIVREVIDKEYNNIQE